MSGGIEAVAIKNLQTILKSRGISAEALFSKYDLDDNGTLNLSEFEGALTSITGQKAPGAIVNAIFSVLDSDGNGVIDLREILTLVDSGPSESYIVRQFSHYLRPSKRILQRNIRPKWRNEWKTDFHEFQRC